MYSKNNKKMIIQKEQEKINYYGIKKFNVGTASVLIAAGFAFLGGGSALASNDASATITNTETVNNNVIANKEEVSTTTPAKANKTNLSAAIARVQEAIAKAGVSEKTASVIEDAKVELVTAQELEVSEVATQGEVDRATVALKNKAFVLESMKKSTAKEVDKPTEEKVNKNQDPRNGQAIPGKGESGFRDTGTVADGTENPVVVNTNDITQKASELEAEIAKVESLISAENAKREGKKDKEFIEILTQVKESAQAVKNKGSNIPTTEKEKHALLQELKAKVDLLKLYQAKKLDWGAPANNHLANYGNNPTNAIISNLNDTFGTPDFSVSDSHEKVVENQRNGLSGTILGSAKYHWKEKNISVSDAIAGALDGWKIVDKPGKNIVTLVKPEQPTDIQRQNGATEREYNPNSAKVYDNKGKANMDGQGAPNSSGKLLNTMIITPKIEAPEAGSGTVNKDFYLELRKQGTTIYKDFDVNPNSHLYAHLLYAGAYGKLALASTGEKVKLKIVDAYTGAPLSELKREDKKAPDTEFLLAPGSGNRGVSALRRVIQIPDGTTKVRVFIEAADQPTGSNLGGEVEDGYIVAGLGLTTGPALSLTTTVVSGRDKEAYGFTDDSIYKNEQEGTLEVTLSNRGGLDVSRDTKYKVTVTVPQGVKLGSIQGKDLNEANGFAVFAPSYTTGFRYDKQTRELSFEINIPNRKIEPKTGKTDTVKIPFIVTPDYVGEATFKITGQNGFGGKDTLGNAIYPYGFAPDANRYNLPENFRANSLNTSDNPEYKYNRSIYIDSMTGNSTITVPVGTTFEKAKEAATLSTEELLNSEAYREKLATLKATAALNLSETSLIAMVQGYSTAAVKENSGTLKVPVIHTVGSKNFNNQIDINVNVVASTTQQKVVLEGDIIQNDDIKEKITPATIPGYTATTNNVQNMPTTTGKAGQIINVETTVSYTKGNVVLPETVTVPVLVLPKAKGEVEVHKGASVDKVKEVAKAKATEVATSADFKAKLPERSKDVVVGEITKEVLATITAEKGTNKGIVKVPVTYTVDGTTYTRDAEITVNVLGSEPKTVYTVEGTKPDAEKVKNAVTPGTGGTVNTPKETDLPATTVKAGTPDVTVPTTVTYPTGDETVNVPVEVLPKATPEKVTTLKDTTGENLTTAVKEKAQAALGKLTLPSGVTVELVPNQDYTVPTTDSNGDKGNVPVKVQYKDATGTVVADDTINVPVTVVSSTPSKIVVFEGDEVTADAVKGAVTPGTDGTKGTPVIPTDLTKQSGEKEVTLPVAYDGITDPEQVKVPVTVLPKATGEADVPKGSTVDKVKEVAKAKASALVEEAAFKGKLPTGATVTVGDITEEVLATITAEKGTNKGVVNIPATYTVDGKTYNTTVPVTINVLGSEPKTVYTVEGTKPDAEKVKNAVTPGTGGTVNAPTAAGLPETTGKVGAKDVTVPTTVTYPTGDETVNVPVEVLPKAIPEKVTTLKDTTGENLTTAVKEKAQAALGKLTLPTGVTVELVPNQDYTVPATDSNGDKDNVPVKVQYKDATGTVVADDTINVPVTVVSSTPSKIVVFEGDKVTADAVKGAVTPGTDGTKGEPTTLPETAGKAGATDVKVDVPVTYDNGKLTETVSVPVIVLPKPEAEEILVAKNSDKEKAKEKVLAKAKKAIEDATFKGKLPADATVEIDNTVPVTIPELTDDTEVEVTVKYTVPGQDTPLTTKVKVPVTIVEGVPQIVPIKENNDVLPNPEKSIDKTDYPEGATFRYKTPEGQTTPIDVTTPGDKDVTVEVLDKNGNPIAEVPATVRVVESYPKYVPVDPAKKQPDPKENINPNDFPTGTTFEYKDNTPVDTTTPGEKPVTVVAKLNGQPIVEIPATIVVVEPKTQYVPVNAENDKKPKPQNSITPDDYPEGSTFEYKTPEGQTTPYDGTTPGEKDVTVVVKDSDGDTIVEVPAKIKVVQGKEQLIPVNAEDKDKPKAEDSITPSDYPEGSTFEYKVPEGQTTPYDGTTPGDKPVTVVVKDKDGKVLVEVPATIKVVESKPKPIETPVTNTPLEKDDYTKGLNIPEGATAKVGDLPDLTTPGEKTPVKVTITLPNGKSYTVDVPVNVTPVKEIETPVTNTPLTPEDYTKGIKIPEGGKVTNVANIPDLTTPGKKDPVKVTIELPNGKVITVEVPVIVTPKSTPTPRPEKPSTTEVTVNPEKSKATVVKEGEKVLPNTGIADDNSTLAGLGLAILGLVGLVRRRKQK